MEFNVDNVITCLKELLTVWINSILYYHDVYPSYIFDEFKSFNLIVHKTRSNLLNKYIDDFIDAFTKLLIDTNRVADMLVILYQEKTIYFKYTILFDEFILPLNANTIQLQGFNWDTVFREFRSFLFYHIQTLEKNKGHKEFQFKIITTTDRNLDTSLEWVNAKPISLSTMNSQHEVSTGFLTFNSYYQIP